MIEPLSKSNQARRSAIKGKAKAVKKAAKKKTQSKKAGKEKVGQRMRIDVFARDKHQCVLCGDSPKKNPACVLNADHIIPKARGGKAVEENLATLCRPCNAGKGARILDIMRAIGHALKPSP